MATRRLKYFEWLKTSMANGFKTPQKVAACLVDETCVKKVKLSLLSMTLLGFLAGVYIAFGGELMTIVTSDLVPYLGMGFSKFLGGSVFATGLILVVVAGAELFTGNTQMMAGWLGRSISGKELLRNWGVVYFSNFLGFLFIVCLIYFSGQWKLGDYTVGATALNIAIDKVNLGWIEAFARGILCNWLVCLAVWMASAAQDIIGKIFAIYFPIMAFVASGFLWNNLISVTLGNILGGALFVGGIYYFAYLLRR